MSIRKKLFDKIHEYHEILTERAEIESENPGISDSNLCEIDDEYACLSRRQTLVQDEIDSLMLDFKATPLDNLTSDEIKDLDFFFRSSDLSFELNIERHLDFRLLVLKEEIKMRHMGTVAKLRISGISTKGDTILSELMKKGVLEEISSTEVRLNANKSLNKADIREIAEDDFEKVWGILQQSRMVIQPLMLADNLVPHTRGFYKEAVRCYEYGFFEASCVLCRAIIESIAERYIKNCGKGHLLVGKDNDKKGRSIPDILRNELAMPIEIIKLYSQIVSKADNILHNEDEKTSPEDALQTIKSLQSFIKKFPKTL